MSHKYMMLLAALVFLLIPVGVGTIQAAPKTVAPVHIQMIGPGGEVANTNGDYLIVVASRSGSTLTNVRVVDVLPKGATAVKSSRPYKMVGGRPTWMLNKVTPYGLTFKFRLRWPATLQIGKRLCNVVNADVVGLSAAPATGHWCGDVVPAPPGG